MRPPLRPQFERQAIDDAKAKYNISDIAARWVAKPLERAGHEMKALCLFHVERTPSMRLNDPKGQFYCFGCGVSGDIVDFIQRHEGLNFPDALRWLGAAELPPVDPAKRHQQVAAESEERLRKKADAVAFWRGSSPIEGTPAETYLRARGITIALPETLRFGMIPKRRNEQTDEWERTHPCLIGGCQDGTGEFVGIQRVFFKDDNPRLGKADCKLSLGQVKGAALRLGPPQEEVILTEGPEDALSIMQDQPGRSVWVALGTGLMPFVQFPELVWSVMIAGQNDVPGMKAVDRAADALADRGFGVRKSYPDPRFSDWNDWLRGIERG